tara:strand:+ start:311 stop:865 length:555 start_codon:yes stop_codon:yes gene_type:complete
MALKKKTAIGPKAKLMKKNLTQLKAQAKRLKIKGFSTKKKEALVKSIMLAEARKKKSKAPKKTMGASASKKRMIKKRGAMPDRVMRNPARTGRVMMSDGYNGFANYETWLLNLYYSEVLEEFVREEMEGQDPYTYAEFMRDYIEEYMLEGMEVPLNMGFATDLFNAGFEKVDFVELAQMYIEEL